MKADDYYTEPEFSPIFISSDDATNVATKQSYNEPLSRSEKLVAEYLFDQGDQCAVCERTVGVSLSGDYDEHIHFDEFYIMDQDCQVLFCVVCYESTLPTELEEEVANA